MICDKYDICVMFLFTDGVVLDGLQRSAGV